MKEFASKKSNNISKILSKAFEIINDKDTMKPFPGDRLIAGG